MALKIKKLIGKLEIHYHGEQKETLSTEIQSALALYKDNLKKITERGTSALACKVLPGIKGVWSHKLPTTEKNLKRKFEKYQEDGYRSLVNGNYGNQNTRIVNEHLEELLKCIYTQSWNPNYVEVHRDYMAFVSGVKLLVWRM